MNKAPTYIIEKIWTAELPKELSNSYLESRDFQLPRVIYPDIRVLTANKGTQNDTFYPEESLRGNADNGTGLISFNRPYAIPILRDHLDTPSSDGRYASDVYGRIYHPAQIHANGGEKFVRCMGTITHPEAIEAILTGRWLTVSLGSKTESVRCSICKGELTEGLCDHKKGKMYETDDEQGTRERCRWVIGPIRAREVSFVVSPSDDQAGILTPNLNESVSETLKAMPRLLVGDDKGIFDLSTGAMVQEGDLFDRPRTRKIFGGLTLLGSEVSLKESAVKQEKRRVEPQSESEATRWMKEDFIGPGKYLLSGWDHDHTVVLDQRGDGTSSPGQMPPTQFQSPGYMYPTMSSEALGGTGPAKGRGMGDGDNTRPDPAPVQTGDQEDHTHEVLGGRVMKAGYPTHSHDLEPAHAALERAAGKPQPRLETPMPDTKLPEGSTPESSVTDDTPLTLGVLYNLPEDDHDFNTPDGADESLQEAKLSTSARDALDASAFCGPDRSFPAHDQAHVTAGLRLLNRSKYSAEQKARIHSCLSSRAKKYGIQVGESQAFAAKLVDTNHHLEFGLYALPANLEEAEALLAQVESKPHPPTEKEQILSRIAAHCKDVLPMSSWQALFGTLTACEAGDPVEIAINAENYGLIYTLSSVIVPSKPAEAINPSGEDQALKESGNEPEKPAATSPAAEVKEIETSTDTGVPVIALPKQTEGAQDKTTMPTDDPATDIVRETMKSLQHKVTESDQVARYALAHSAAIYMKTLRKPFARGKSNEELIETLSKRSVDSLRDTLSDLLQEMDTTTIPTPQPLPKLDDPTKTDPTSTLDSKTKESVTQKAPDVPPADKREEQDDTSKPQPKTVGGMLGGVTALELPDEEEETWTVLGHMWGLKVQPK